jgi:hypothetical protein
LRDDRQVADLIRTDVKTGGGFNFEFSFGDAGTNPGFEDFFKRMIGSDADWSTQTTHMAGDANIEVVIAAAGSTITASTGTPFATVVIGDWIKTGNGSAANNGVFKVTARSDTVLTVEPTGVLADQTVGASAVDANYSVIELSAVVNGTEPATPFYFEREYGDLSNEFVGHYGQAISSGSLSVEPGSIITGAFEFLGQTAASVTATEGDGSNVAATTTTVMNAVDNVDYIMEGSVAYACTAYNQTVTPNLRPRMVIGTLGAESMGQGTIGVTGGHTAFYEDKTLIDKHLDMTSSNLAIVFVDEDGNYYVFDYPHIRYSSGSRVGGGINQDVLAEMEWTAIRESTEDITIRIARYTAP